MDEKRGKAANICFFKIVVSKKKMFVLERNLETGQIIFEVETQIQEIKWKSGFQFEEMRANI